MSNLTDFINAHIKSRYAITDKTLTLEQATCQPVVMHDSSYKMAVEHRTMTHRGDDDDDDDDENSDDEDDDEDDEGDDYHLDDEIHAMLNTAGSIRTVFTHM